VLNELKASFLIRTSIFFENVDAASEEQGEGFHQDIKEMENLYRGQTNVHMMGAYC
jgi:hypothetical protein